MGWYEQFQTLNKEIKDLDHSMHVMHNDMSRLNTLISKNKQLQELLANDNFVLEMDIVTRLKELEGEAVKIEQKIDQCADEKKQVRTESFATSVRTLATRGGYGWTSAL